MKVTATASEILEAGLWEEYCELAGVNIWALNEGLMSMDETLELPDEIATQILEGREDTITK